MTRVEVISARETEISMQTRLRLLHIWQQQLYAILVGVRVTQINGLALLVTGIMLAGSVRLSSVAAAVPGRACDESRVRQLRRWLASTLIPVETMWSPIRRTFLADRRGQRLTLVFDPTPQGIHTTILVVGLVQHKRVLPLAWRIVPQQEQWDERMATYLRDMAREIDADLPPGCHVTLLADRGITGPHTIAAVRSVGWHIVFRLSAGVSQANRVRVDGQIAPLWVWLKERNFRWSGPVEVSKDAGWITVELTVIWNRPYKEPWILVSDEPAGPKQVHAYRRRVRIEATFADTKTRGFEIERTRIDRLNRLLLVLVIALWWRMQMGLRVIRTGQRSRYDRTDRRDRSVLKLGGRALDDCLLHDRGPALPFSQSKGQWRYAYYA
jgi:Transposase DDE domain